MPSSRSTTSRCVESAKQRSIGAWMWRPCRRENILGPSTLGEVAKTLYKWLCSCGTLPIQSAQKKTPLFSRACGNSAGDHVARLKKFYGFSAQKEVLRRETNYTKRGREIYEIA